MSIRDILSDTTLQQKKVLEKLLCHYVGIDKKDIFTSYEKEVSKDQYDAIIAGYNAYIHDKKPLEFILGFVEFFQRRFAVDGRCLIPRPETEYMIQAVNEHIATIANTKMGSHVLVDVGTGCGVLGLSVLLENPGFFSDAYLSEYYPDTLTLAGENTEHYAQSLQPKPKLVQSNLVAFLQEEPHKTAIQNSTQNQNITLVANLPYIPDETFDTQTEDNVRKREPRPAFVGGTDGLDFYREMFAQIFAIGKPQITMFLEMMTRQVDILRKEFGAQIHFEEIKTFHFNIRIVKATLV